MKLCVIKHQHFLDSTFECEQCGRVITHIYTLSDGRKVGIECARKAINNEYLTHANLQRMANDYQYNVFNSPIKAAEYLGIDTKGYAPNRNTINEMQAIANL